MAEEKFPPEYFEKNYHITDYKVIYTNVVFRNEDSSGESQINKEPCLRACFSHYLGQDLTSTKRIAEHFITDGKLHRDHLKRCCCSEEVWKTDDERTRQRVSIFHAVVTHKLTNISFIVGKDCFNKLFWNAEDADTFFKEECKYCKQIVKVRNTDRPNFCNQKCVKAYEIQEHKKRIVYVPPPPVKKIWPQKVYEQCIECDKPKYTEKQRKCKLCYDCYQSDQSDKMLRTPDGEIHGWAD